MALGREGQVYQSEGGLERRGCGELGEARGSWARSWARKGREKGEKEEKKQLSLPCAVRMTSEERFEHGRSTTKKMWT